MKIMLSFKKQIFTLIITFAALVLFTPNYADAVSADKAFNVKNGVLISYTGNDSEVIIPETVNGQAVSTIGATAFANNKTIISVKIPDSVTVIEANAFERCEEMTSVKLSSSLKSIDTWAFGYCSKLSDITLPDNLESIGSAAFYGCKALKEITVPDSVKSIGTHCFRDCTALSKVTLSKNLKTLTLRTFSACSSLRSLEIPDSVTEIGDECFYNAGIEKITFSANLQKIGNRAFYGCGWMVNFSFNDSLKTVGEEAFADCIRLDRLEFPQGMQSIGTKAFSGCYSIRTVVFGGTKDIGEQAFAGCARLHTVYLSSRTEKIGAEAFNACYSLVEVFNPSSLAVAAESDDYGGLARYAMIVHSSEEEEALLKVVDDYMFMTVDGGNYLVGYLGKKNNLYLPESFEDKTYNIARYAFCGKNNIRQVNIPNAVSRIEKNAFLNCTTLSWVKIPSSVISIGDSAFSGCEALSSIAYDGTKAQWNSIAIEDGNQAVANVHITYLQELVKESEDKSLGAKIAGSLAELFEGLSNSMFFINFLLTLLWAAIFLYSPRYDETEEDKKRKKMLFVIICCVQWVLISGLRAVQVGADTENYLRLFDLHNSMAWRELLESTKEYYLGNGTYNDYEIGFILFERIIGAFTSSHILYNVFVAGIFMSALGRFIYKNSDDPFISFILYDAFMFNMFSLTGYRQIISVAIGILLGYEFVKKRKFVPFIVLILVASLFHKSTLIFIIFYFLSNKKVTNAYLFTAFATVAALIVARNKVFNYVKVIVGYENYTGTYGFAQETFLLLLIVLTAAVLICRPQILAYADEKGIQNIDYYYNALILSWIMLPFAMVSPTSMRLVYDFGFISFLLLMPVFVKSFYKRNNRLIVYGVFILVLGYFILAKSPDYMFFWQT